MVMFSETQPSSQLEALLLQTAAGNREAFASLYHRTSPSVYGLALTYVRSGPDAEDVTQDTFVKVWDNASSYRPQGKPLAWILTIAKNLALMCLRSRGEKHPAASGGLGIPGHGCPGRYSGGPAGSESRSIYPTPTGTADSPASRSVRTEAPGNRRPAWSCPLPTVLSKYHRGLKKLKIKLEGDAVYE